MHPQVSAVQQERALYIQVSVLTPAPAREWGSATTNRAFGFSKAVGIMLWLLTHIRALPPVLAMLGGKHNNGVHQCLYLQGQCLPSPAQPANAFSFVNDSPSHIVAALFKLLLFYWVSGWMRPQASLLRGHFGIFGYQLHWFARPDSLRAHLSGVYSRGQGAWCGMPAPQSSRRSSHLVRSLSIVCDHTKGEVLARVSLFLSYPSQCGPFYPLLWSRCSASSQVLFRGNWSTCSSIFVVSVRGGKFRPFLCHHLDSTALPLSFSLYLQMGIFKLSLIAYCHEHYKQSKIIPIITVLVFLPSYEHFNTEITQPHSTLK